MKVLVIPEDQENDQYIVKPVLERLFEDLGLSAQVTILPEPRLRGDQDALDRQLIAQIVTDRAPMTDLFLLVIDRDCNREKHEQRLQARVAEHGAKMLGVLAVQEIECWMMALHEPSALGARWQEIRDHCDSKEAYAEPLLAKLGSLGPGGGRKAAMRALKSNWKRLLDRCEELQDLRERIRAHFAKR